METSPDGLVSLPVSSSLVRNQPVLLYPSSCLRKNSNFTVGSESAYPWLSPSYSHPGVWLHERIPTDIDTTAPSVSRVPHALAAELTP